ncbi:hypothetical protein [Roseateles sp.]|uniref:hypothetical protein n=1 Tax=Roseateles sp. TaxID=1971397 RepID=UPI0025E308E7|nr:hypothetical protein [Roseateles sp.]MBV8036532.1 hypothetical protein [Roseateles sp.]
MRTSTKFASLLVLFTSFASAQQSTFDGKWSGPATSPSAGQIQVNLTIAKGSGTMRYAQKVNYTTVDQCANRDIPVSVVSQTASEMVIAIQGAKVLKGCIDETATLKLVDGKTLQSTLKDGRAMTLARSK